MIPRRLRKNNGPIVTMLEREKGSGARGVGGGYGDAYRGVSAEFCRGW